jgi:hypothetical protein
LNPAWLDRAAICGYEIQDKKVSRLDVGEHATGDGDAE